ncbi:hypothetical protein UT300005_16870 [Clostridium sp. CTA-5]
MAITYVVDGAIIKCSQGIGESVINKENDINVELHDKKMLSIADNKPYINIKPFSLCKSQKNPEFKLNGMKPVPCNPSICMKWMGAKSDVYLKGELVLNSECKLGCMNGGIIEIIDDGQRK